MSDFLEDIKRDQDDLVPAIAQDSTTGEVLMVAWVTDEAVLKDPAEIYQ